MKLSTAQTQYQKLMRGKQEPFTTADIQAVYESCQQYDAPGDKLFYAISNALTLGYMTGWKAAQNGPKQNKDQ